MTSGEPSRIGNPKNDKFRGLDELDQDVLFDLGGQIIKWIQATTGGGNSHHFGIREPQDDKKGIKAGKATLRSLLLVSHKFNSTWTPTSIHNVTLWTYQLPSFLRFLIKYPDRGSQVRSLNFICREQKERMDAQEIAKELVLSGHPRLSNIDLPDDDPRRNFQLYDLIFQIIGISRSLIVERCTNLKNLTFNSEMSFPFNLSGSPQPIFSDRLSSIKTVEFALGEHEDRKIWTGRQALALLIFLPSLQSASLVFKLNHKDARIINTHLPSLIKSKRSLSKVKNLSLRIHHQLPKRNHQFFDCNSTMKTFISIFDRLENFTLKSYEDPMMSNPMFPAALRESRREQHPTMSVLEGLNSSALSLKSLSVEGLFQTEEMGKEFHSCLERMKNLEHLRMDGLSFGSLVDLYLVNRGPNLLVSDGEKTCWMLPDCKTFELADNYVPNSEGLEDISGLNAEIFLVTMLKEGFFPRENLRLIRSPRLVTPQPRESDWQRHAFKFEDTRKVLVNEASELGIEVEYV